MKSSLQWIQSLDLPLRFVIFFGVHTIAVVGCFPGTVAIEMAIGLSMNLYYGLACIILYRWTQKRLEQYPQAKKWMEAGIRT
ncbi:SNARE associated Golgi protein [Galdieria sulphuraria]|uniref:SNARE associated Golgi protein n=1 Tax=Galdieria sulphuraria TaxID=130081 RepID=M2XV84_GALSU|nr:SNARE associated Golgi protein [Galdieria sulphuraria]EME27314.1 SNARE associated Golgi protein [Galdieria sulphuraria]|eukprot:XP_005703834.1 SNARE associated Golgi protein [Galdieria sulphuraria]